MVSFQVPARTIGMFQSVATEFLQHVTKDSHPFRLLEHIVIITQLITIYDL